MRCLLWLVAGAWLLFAAGWWLLHGWIVPRIGEFRPRMEVAASRALGVPVRIGSINARSEGMFPSFELRDVSLLDKEGREAVRLPHLSGALSLASLWGLGFEQLVIDRPELDIRRAVDGKIFVGGLEVSKDADSGHSRVADWLFSQTEFVFRGGTLRWTDEMRQAPPLVLSQVDGALRNSRRRHSMRLDATPPAGWGERFSVRYIFRQPLLSRSAGDISSWSGQLYADFQRVDVARVQPYVSFDSPGMALSRGRGALRAWADVSRGKITGAVADVALRDVQARLGAKLEALEFESLAGRFSGARLAGGFEASTERLQFRTRDGLLWPGGNLALVHLDDQPGSRQEGTLKADRLDLVALSRIASRLPLDSRTQELIASFAPRGLVETLDARWQGPLDAPASFAAKGRVVGLNVAALPAPLAAPAAVPGGRAASAVQAVSGRPGLSGATVDFNFTQDGGQASVKIVKGALDLPGVFEEPRLLFDHLSTEAQWKIAGQKIDLQLRNLQFANADAQGQAQVRWRTDDVAATGPAATGRASDRGFPGVLDLQGVLSRGDGSRVHRYLPLVVGADARRYVREAVLKGQVSDVKFKVKGPVEHLPFSRANPGDFQISAKVRDGHFLYVPKFLQPSGAAPWPALTELNGELVFNRAALDIKNASGKVAGLPGLQLVKGDARIADMMHDATVEVTTDIRGALTDAFGFVNTSPIGGMTSQALANATATGTGEYRFRLILPINEIDKSRVEGAVTLPGNDVRFVPNAPQLAALKGVINVTERGFTVAGAQARVLGGEVRIDGGTHAAVSPGDSKISVAFKAQGTLTAEALRQAKELGFASRLAEHASGGTAYTASVLFRRGIPEVTISSSLQGMALNFPAPLAKTAETVLPLRFENALLPASLNPGQTLQDQLSVNIGRVASINYVRDVSGAEPRVIRGGIGVGLEGDESAPTPPAGVAANIKLTQLDLDAWEKLLGEPPRGNSQSAAPASQPDAITLGYLPTRLAIRASQLKVQGRSLNQVVVGGTRDGGTWRANIDAAELNGYVEFRQAGAQQGAGRVYARLSRLSLAASQASEVEAILDEQPASIPALDIVVENMELRGKKLGRIEIDAINRGGAIAEGGVREWRLNKFNVIVPEATLSATGNWTAVAPAGPRIARPAGERRRAAMNFKLDIADSGELLGRFGMNGVIRRGKGRLEGQVAWIGSPLSLDYPSLSGQFNVNVESGQFIKADPGIAKLLGVLSLQSLPRRLTLDFRDVFSEGFAFDFVRGDVSINQGVAQTNNLQMSGVNAAVLMEGSADIARETQNLKVVVVPELDAGTASLIATVINPAIGLGSFLAQLFFRRPLTEAATQEFQIDGAWADPKITKIDRRARARAQAGDTPVQNR